MIQCLFFIETTPFTTKSPTSLRTWDMRRIIEIAVPTVVAVLIIIVIAVKVSLKSNLS